METSAIISSPTLAEMVTPKELVKKHIADPTHKVTEEELRRVFVGVLPEEKKNDGTNRFFNEADKLSLA
jgi:hypothetical protein